MTPYGMLRNRYQCWRARRMFRWLMSRKLVIHAPEDEPRLAHYWTHLRTHPWLVDHGDEETR